MTTWEREHREPIGTREQLQAALEGVFGPLAWRASEDLLWAACPFGGEAHACEISLFGAPGAMLLELSVYSAPPAVRAIMSALDLNHCYAQESCALYFPFDAGDHWPGAAG